MLLIGSAASEVADRLRTVAPGAEIEDVRLPASAVRSFERSPADVVLLCGPAGIGRLNDVLEAIRSRPLGGLVPCIAVSDADVEGAEASTMLEASGEELLAIVVELLELESAELEHAPMPASAAPPPPAGVAEGPVTESAVEQKLRQVRHETYYVVLQVPENVNVQHLREAYGRLSARFAVENLALDVERHLRDELAELRDGLEDAYAVLSNERLRAAYAFVRGAS